VVPSVAFETLLTTGAPSPLDDEVVLVDAVLGGEEEPEPLELLPHAANASDAASAGTRNFIDDSIGTPSVKGNEIGGSQRLPGF
jgi:hypothetical protein